MVRIVLVADIESAEQWESGFRARSSLFQDMTQRVAHYCVTDRNQVIIYLEVDDPDRFMSILLSPAVADGMVSDGVKRDTVKFYVLDKTFES